jgi:hypothetical protein
MVKEGSFQGFRMNYQSASCLVGWPSGRVDRPAILVLDDNLAYIEIGIKSRLLPIIEAKNYHAPGL